MSFYLQVLGNGATNIHPPEFDNAGSCVAEDPIDMGIDDYLGRQSVIFNHLGTRCDGRNFAAPNIERDAAPAASMPPAVSGKGKFCSNSSCPLKSRYTAVACIKLRRKCDSTC